ncbi:MAG: hypothetical protein ACOC90_05720, partial [Bacteroidota bacterium]
MRTSKPSSREYSTLPGGPSNLPLRTLEPSPEDPQTIIQVVSDPPQRTPKLVLSESSESCFMFKTPGWMTMNEVLWVEYGIRALFLFL